MSKAHKKTVLKSHPWAVANSYESSLVYGTDDPVPANHRMWVIIPDAELAHILLGKGDSEAAAWKDAASRLKKLARRTKTR